ncbi:GNAT family N-acetyltransferase [Kribbia dieselivorans]|uniref:GNAT family N-acetyltransferase n=1 Tax=Kribbia dieselivorans TaxID=331526 RepID=UPI000837B498|nr:GNAT family N-acetyltransferase [Kribbia dieselivorans]
MQPLTTPRLVLRDFSPNDAPAVLEIHQHPDLARFMPHAALTDLDGARTRIDEFRVEEPPGLGWWCVALRDGPVIGAVLLKDIPGSGGRPNDDVQIGWRQGARHTGHGYMTEAARAVLRHGFDDLGLERIIAVVDLENHPSQRICARLGMTPLGHTCAYYDEELELFEMSRPKSASRPSNP